MRRVDSGFSTSCWRRNAHGYLFIMSSGRKMMIVLTACADPIVENRPCAADRAGQLPWTPLATPAVPRCRSARLFAARWAALPTFEVQVFVERHWRLRIVHCFGRRLCNDSCASTGTKAAPIDPSTIRHSQVIRAERSIYEYVIGPTDSRVFDTGRFSVLTYWATPTIRAAIISLQR